MQNRWNFLKTGFYEGINIDQENTDNAHAPTRFSLGVEFLEETHQVTMKEREAEAETQELRKVRWTPLAGQVRGQIKIVDCPYRPQC